MAQIVLESHSRREIVIVLALISLPSLCIFTLNINTPTRDTIKSIVRCSFRRASNSDSDPLSWPHLSQDELDELILKKTCPKDIYVEPDYANRWPKQCPSPDYEDYGRQDKTSTFLSLIRNNKLVHERRCWVRNAVGIRAIMFSGVGYGYDAQLITVDGFNGTGPWKTETIAAVNNKPLIREGVRIFQIASLQHDFFLFRTRNISVGHPYLDEVRYQNVDFTKALLWSKAIYFVMISMSVAWFSRRLRDLSRPLAFLEYLLLLLGISAAVRNVPLGFLDFPAEHLLDGLLKDTFYVIQLCFLVLLTKENFLLDATAATCERLKQTRTSLIVITAGGLVHLVINAWDRCLVLMDPFSSIWNFGGAKELVLCLIVVTTGMLIAYVIYLCYLLYRVDGALNNEIQKPATFRIVIFRRLIGIAVSFCIVPLLCFIRPPFVVLMLVVESEGYLMICIFFITMLYITSGMMNTMCSQPRTSTTVMVSEKNRNVFRYYVLMMFSFVCAVIAVSQFIAQEILEYPDISRDLTRHLETMTLHFGADNMWNLYVVSLLYLYGPSDKLLRQIKEKRSKKKHIIL